MAEPLIGEIRPVAFGMIPNGWALCNGQSMSIQQNAALFSLLNTTYGGDGKTTFNLPDLRGRIPMGVGQYTDSTVSTYYRPGMVVGTAGVVVTAAQIPVHDHTVQTASDAGTVNTPASNYLGTVPGTGVPAYGTAPTQTTQQVALNTGALSSVGSSAPHSNMQPYTTINYIIALIGYYPQRND